MNKAIYAKLFEPATLSKKKCVLDQVAKGQRLPPPDIAEIKKRLQAERKEGVGKMQHLVAQFQKSVAKDNQLATYLANSSCEAASTIKRLIGDADRVYSNNSGTVQEVSDELHDEGVDVCYNYFSEQSINENRLNQSWLLPNLNCEPHEDWFSVQKKFSLVDRPEESHYYDAIALVGVNSAAADDGTLFLLQHSSNIEKLLKARKVIFLVGMEKIVASQREAKFQTRWAGNFGLQHVLMNLDKKEEPAESLVSKCFTSFSKISGEHPDVSVIILDNGRSRLHGTVYEPVLRCISCRSCMRECPTYKFFGKKFGRYPQQYLFYYLIGKIDHIDLCSFCNNCSYECPVGIDIAEMNSLAKGSAHSSAARWKTRLLGNAELLSALTKAAMPIAGPIFKNSLFKFVTEKTAGIHRKRQLPIYDSIKLRGVAAKTKATKTVIYYPGCWSSFFEHEVYNATLTFFDLLDYHLVVADDKCCGLPLIASGEIEAARTKADILVNQLLKFDRSIDIITTCPSCALALKKDYIDLGISGAEKISGRVFDVLEYILGLEELKTGRLKFRHSDVRLAYHLPCHQRVQNLGHVALESLRKIPGLTVTDVERGCCGISGAWGQKKQFYEYSMVTGEEVFGAIRENGYSAITTECGTCKLQMVHGTGMETVHPITLLADLAYLDPEPVSNKTVC